MADSSNTLPLLKSKASRRAVLAGTAGALAVAFPVIAAEATEKHPDAELLGLYQRWIDNEVAFELSAVDSDEDANAFVDGQTVIEHQIAAAPAQTMAGLAVKLTIACDTGCVISFGDDPPSRAAASALQDALRLAGMAGRSQTVKAVRS